MREELDLTQDPWDPWHLSVNEAVELFQADVAFDYIPIGAALEKYSILLQVLSINRTRLTLEETQRILTDAHLRMMKKLSRAELHIETNGTIPRLPQ